MAGVSRLVQAEVKNGMANGWRKPAGASQKPAGLRQPFAIPLRLGVRLFFR